MNPNHEKTLRWLALTLLLACLKLIMYVMDPNPQVFLGDSGTYLKTAQALWIPPDRSFVYGFLVRLLTRNSHSLDSVVASQSFAGLVTSLLAATILVRFFRARFAVAAVVAVALTLEPQQLLFERFVLTESLSTAFFAAFLLSTLEYLRSRRLWMLVAMQLAGVILIMLRMTFLPALMITTVCAPIFACFSERKIALRQLAVHLSISLVLFAGLHSGYQRWYGWLANQPPAYSYADGFFLIANVSPLVTPNDTDDMALRPVLAQQLKYAKDPNAMNARNAEMFAEGGLVPRIKDALKDEYRANVESRQIARRVILHSPIEFLGLAFQTYAKFFSKPYMTIVLRDESGISPIDPGVLVMLTQYHLDMQDLSTFKTVTRKFYLNSWPLYILLVNTPLVMLLCVITAGKPRSLLWFLLLIAAVHTASVQIAGVEPSPRHLHAVTVMLAIAAGVLATRVWPESGDALLKSS